jgi:hypothetical protein
MTSGDKGMPLAPFLGEHVIVRLPLPPGNSSRPDGQKLPQERRRIPLVATGRQTDSHPVEVIRHQTVYRNQETVTDRGVKKNLAEQGVKRGREPPGMAIFQGKGPKHEGVPLIPLPGQPGKLAFLDHRNPRYGFQ